MEVFMEFTQSFDYYAGWAFMFIVTNLLYQGALEVITMGGVSRFYKALFSNLKR